MYMIEIPSSCKHSIFVTRVHCGKNEIISDSQMASLPQLSLSLSVIRETTKANGIKKKKNEPEIEANE